MIILAIKTKLLLANTLFEFGKTDEAIIQYKKCIDIALNQIKFYREKEIKMNYKITNKLRMLSRYILQSIINLFYCYKENKDAIKLYATLEMLKFTDRFIAKYVSNMDELKLFARNIIKEYTIYTNRTLGDYLEERAEYGVIAIKLFHADLQTIMCFQISKPSQFDKYNEKNYYMFKDNLQQKLKNNQFQQRCLSHFHNQPNKQHDFKEIVEYFFLKSGKDSDINSNFSNYKSRVVDQMAKSKNSQISEIIYQQTKLGQGAYPIKDAQASSIGTASTGAFLNLAFFKDKAYSQQQNNTARSNPQSLNQIFNIDNNKKSKFLDEIDENDNQKTVIDINSDTSDSSKLDYSVDIQSQWEQSIQDNKRKFLSQNEKNFQKGQQEYYQLLKQTKKNKHKNKYFQQYSQFQDSDEEKIKNEIFALDYQQYVTQQQFDTQYYKKKLQKIWTQDLYFHDMIRQNFELQNQAIEYKNAKLSYYNKFDKKDHKLATALIHHRSVEDMTGQPQKINYSEYPNFISFHKQQEDLNKQLVDMGNIMKVNEENMKQKQKVMVQRAINIQKRALQKGQDGNKFRIKGEMQQLIEDQQQKLQGIDLLRSLIFKHRSNFKKYQLNDVYKQYQEKEKEIMKEKAKIFGEEQAKEQQKYMIAKYSSSESKNINKELNNQLANKKDLELKPSKKSQFGQQAQQEQQQNPSISINNNEVQSPRMKNILKNKLKSKHEKEAKAKQEYDLIKQQKRKVSQENKQIYNQVFGMQKEEDKERKIYNNKNKQQQAKINTMLQDDIMKNIYYNEDRIKDTIIKLDKTNKDKKTKGLNNQNNEKIVILSKNHCQLSNSLPRSAFVKISKDMKNHKQNKNKSDIYSIYRMLNKQQFSTTRSARSSTKVSVRKQNSINNILVPKDLQQSKDLKTGKNAFYNQ